MGTCASKQAEGPSEVHSPAKPLGGSAQVDISCVDLRTAASRRFVAEIVSNLYSPSRGGAVSSGCSRRV